MESGSTGIQGIQWGKVLAGAAIVTAIVAAFAFTGLGGVLASAATSMGSGLTGLSGIITAATAKLSAFAAGHQGLVLGGAAVAGGLAALGISNFTQRISGAAEGAGLVDPVGRGR